MHGAHPSTAIFSFVASPARASNSTSATTRCPKELAMARATETIRTIDLGPDQMLVFDGGRDGRVRVLFGATWLTHEGEADDTILRAGAELALHRGRTVIEGLEPTRLQIVERSSGHMAQPAALLRTLWRSMRRHVVRLQLGQVSVQSAACY
jgi:hypothetical protein